MFLNHIIFSTDADSYEFIIVSLEGKQWHFEAANCEERDEWVRDFVLVIRIN